jgi:hypothetical protein
MPCPYLEEIVMLFCRAYPVKKMVPRDRITTACPCLGESFQTCPLFQEVVARIKYRGHVNRRLVGLLILDTAEPHSGAKVIAEGKEVGWITSSVFSPAVKRPIALGVVRREVEVGAEVELESGGARLKAKLSALPFYRRETSEGGAA